MEVIAEEVELKSVADIQHEIDHTVDSSKLLENEFQADAEGEKYRNAISNTGLLQVHVVSSTLTVHEQLTAIQCTNYVLLLYQRTCMY